MVGPGREQDLVSDNIGVIILDDLPVLLINQAIGDVPTETFDDLEFELADDASALAGSVIRSTEYGSLVSVDVLSDLVLFPSESSLDSCLNKGNPGVPPEKDERVDVPLSR